MGVDLSHWILKRIPQHQEWAKTNVGWISQKGLGTRFLGWLSNWNPMGKVIHDASIHDYASNDTS